MTTFQIRFGTLCVAAVLLTACGEQSRSVTAPENPTYNGGFTFGGGNRSADSTSTPTTASSGEGAAVDSTGQTLGSGNGVLVGSGH
jgi:hypothetical protein